LFRLFRQFLLQSQRRLRRRSNSRCGASEAYTPRPEPVESSSSSFIDPDAASDDGGAQCSRPFNLDFSKAYTFCRHVSFPDAASEVANQEARAPERQQEWRRRRFSSPRMLLFQAPVLFLCNPRLAKFCSCSPALACTRAAQRGDVLRSRLRLVRCHSSYCYVSLRRCVVPSRTPEELASIRTELEGLEVLLAGRMLLFLLILPGRA
jgi:hypothetical protein